MSKLWRWYKNCLTKHPLKTQFISSGVLWGIGEFASQANDQITAMKKNQLKGEEQELKINWRKLATISFLGFAFVGPVGHFWYESLDRFLRSQALMRPNTVLFLGAKFTLNVFLYELYTYTTLSTLEGFASGKSASQVMEDIKKEIDSALDDDEYSGWGHWSYRTGQVAMFRYAPVRYQLLCSNSLMALFCCIQPRMEQTNVRVRLLP